MIQNVSFYIFSSILVVSRWKNWEAPICRFGLGTFQIQFETSNDTFKGKKFPIIAPVRTPFEPIISTHNHQDYHAETCKKEANGVLI
jgi:hypothetical protein